MNRDAVLATIIGFIIGLCLTVIIIFGPSFFKSISAISLPKVSLSKTQSKIAKANVDSAPSSETESMDEGSITIDSPLNDSIIDSAEVTISGKAPAKSKIVISNLNNEIVVQTNESGQYIGKISLNEGKNGLTVFSVDRKTTESKTITVFYTSEEW